MPIREYKCRDCGFQFETIDLGFRQGHGAEASSCPRCGARSVEKKVSLFASPTGDSPSSGKEPPAGKLG